MRRCWAIRTVMLLACLLLASPAAGEGIDFSLHKLESGRPGKTILVVGGIQGDEPGGFSAASLLISHYRIVKGEVWVVPNLNFLSIIRSSRGVYGDLNRKFSSLGESDPEYELIAKIKSIILDKRVDIVLNLHDGSGFYRSKWQDKWHNPDRWGQSVIIDQPRLAGHALGELSAIAKLVVSDVNGRLYDPEHIFQVKDTETRLGDVEMEKTLTYFAIRNNKPAFGLETSKSFPTQLRAFYHLRMIEAFMNLLGVEYHKDFVLSAEQLKRVMDNNMFLALNQNKIVLDLRHARQSLQSIPLKKDALQMYAPSSPIMAVVGAGEGLDVYYGNRNVTRIKPRYVEYDSSTDSVDMEVDGAVRRVGFGETIRVGRSFRVVPRAGYRAHLIGCRQRENFDHAGLAVSRDDFEAGSSVDMAGCLFRVEVYRGEKFSGMVLVNFRLDEEDDPHLSALQNLSLRENTVWRGVVRLSGTPGKPTASDVFSGY